MATTETPLRDTGGMPRRTPRLPDPDDLASRRLKYERERRGWSTGELARRITEAGVPMRQPAVWQVESGTPRRKLSLAEAMAVAEVFGISVYDLTEPPGELVTAEVVMFLNETESLAADLTGFYERALRLLERIDALNQNAKPLLDYMGATGFRAAELDRLQDRLAKLAELSLKLRDAIWTAAVSPGETT